MEHKEPTIQPETKPEPKSIKFWVSVAIGIVTICCVLFFISLGFWYRNSLQPVNSTSKEEIRFEIKSGEGNGEIAERLQDAKLIQNAFAMVLYLKLNSMGASLQAGSYVLSPKMSTAQIAGHIASGKTDTLQVTILPGQTLAEIKKNLAKYGYTNSEIDAAFSAKYDSPLLADKPATADLEGYIYPETFEVNAGDSPKKLISRSMNTLYSKMQSDDLINQFKAQGLNMHQALTVASIVQKEASKPSDQPQVAQVFLTRLKMGMKLESDVTFHYGAEKLGVEPNVNLDSPYNTRLVAGLPPTPIANMNYSALQAVAHPASGDYLYFIAGDNGKIYFAHTLEEHQENIKKYCQKLCGNAF